MRSIWIFAVARDGAVQSDNAAAAEPLKASGADEVLSLEHPSPSAYSPDLRAAAIAEAAKRRSPDIVLMGATPIGSEVASTVAAKLGTGLTAHCADPATREDRELVAVLLAFGDRLPDEILVPAARLAMAAVREARSPAGS